jgi:hypothetical protein
LARDTREIGSVIVINKLVHNWNVQSKGDNPKRYFFWRRNEVHTGRSPAIIHTCNGKYGWIDFGACPFYHKKAREFTHFFAFFSDPGNKPKSRYFNNLEDAKEYANKILVDSGYVLINEKLEVLL